MQNVTHSLNSTTVRSNGLLRGIGWALRLTDTLLPRLAERAAAELFLTPRRREVPERERAWTVSASPERRRITGVSLATWRWGNEPRPVLLIHGWEGRGSQMGAFAVALQKERISAVAPDLPAHGASKGRKTNLIEIAAVIRDLIARHEPAAIITHSFGAPATMIALRSVPFDGRLVFIAPPEDFGFFTDTYRQMLGIPASLAQRMQQEIERRLEVDWSELRGRVVAREMSAPLLVIHDENDRDVPPRYGAALAAEWPAARYHPTRGLGHHRILREPAILDEALRFIRA